MPASQSYDYIIIGAGAAGCVLANQLSADPDIRVLLLEAGSPDSDPRLHRLDGFVQMWGSAADWAFATEPQPGMANRSITLNQGKVLGGGTSLNAMMYVRGNRRNYDDWRTLGAEGWSHADVLPVFKAIEDYEGGASEMRGSGGPIRVRDCPDPAARSGAFMTAACEIGYDGPNWDSNGARQENGAGLLQFHVDDSGRRVSGVTAFLDPVRSRPNLCIETGALVARILIEGGRATGVAYLQNGATKQARAEGEVILAAGAILSPKLLMLSGIGPAGPLREAGIAVQADLAGVGQNLRDHVQLPIVFRRKTDAPAPSLLTGNVLFVPTRDSLESAAPDMQLNFTPAVPAPLAPMLNLPFPACIFLPILVQPFSAGEVRLRSADPKAAPIVNPRYLGRDADMQAFGRILEIIRAIAGAPAFSELNAGEVAPGPDADFAEYVRSRSSTLWHPVGTCRMGRDAMAVVDPELRVRGIDRLRVADASVMPATTSGNTVAPTFMIGWKAADLVLAARRSAVAASAAGR